MAPVLEPLDLNLSKLSIDTSRDAPSPGGTGSEANSAAIKGPLSRLSAYQLPNMIVREYLREKEPVFRALDDLREAGWNNTEGDKHFQKLRERADSSNHDKTQQKIFWDLNIRIGHELHGAGAFDISNPVEPNPTSLHLCIAPGGYTWHLLEIYPEATVKGITLPPHLGGHPMCLDHGDKDPRVQVKFMDLTMLAVEFGTSMSEIPKDHPDVKKFSSDRPFLGETFDLVISDGQILRTHFREEYRQNREVLRLNVAQLILGLTRIKRGGTFVMLLHKADAFDNIELLKVFDTIAKIRLFKPRCAHSQRSSFYLIAKDVDPTHPKAQEAIRKWKDDWKKATITGDEGTGMNKEMQTVDHVKAVLEEFGPRLIQLGKEIWLIQKNALAKASYTKPASPRSPSNVVPRAPYTKFKSENAAPEARGRGGCSHMDSPATTWEYGTKASASPNLGPESQKSWRK